MTRLQILGLAVILGFVQLAWIAITWKRRGFRAALALIAYGMLSVAFSELMNMAE